MVHVTAVEAVAVEHLVVEAVAVEPLAVASVVLFGPHSELFLWETVWVLPCRRRNLCGSTLPSHKFCICLSAGTEQELSKMPKHAFI